MLPGDKNRRSGIDTFHMYLSCVFLSDFCLKLIVCSYHPDRGCPLTIDNAAECCLVLSFYRISLLFFFFLFVKIHILVKETIIHRRVSARARLLQSFARWLYILHANPVLKLRSQARRYERGTFSRIGPVQTSLRPKANRSIHEKHDPRTKSERDTGGESPFGAGSLWKLPDLA